jgi:pimeloyl-ACP methyl ester carboxylesterase
MISNRSNVLTPDFVSEKIDINGVNIHYQIGGDPNGQPVLLWHGFLSTSYAWRKVMTLLIAHGYAVLVPDMRGYGDSDKPAGTEGYDARALAEEFRALVSKIGFGAGRPLILVAHDMGAPPALLWAADYPEEIAGLLYVEAPVMLSEILTKIIAYTPEAMKEGSMWWWILPFAPDVPERLVVGNERAFLTWFYERSTFDPNSIDSATVDEVLRTFSGREGVLGAMGVYRAAFITIAQTTPLTEIGHQVTVPVVALGGEKGLGGKVGKTVKAVAQHVEDYLIPNCGHFMPEECPDEIVRHLVTMTAKLNPNIKGSNLT